MFEIPDPNSITRVADWVELVISTSSISLSKAQLASNIEGASGKEPKEHFLSNVWQELSQRQSLHSSPIFEVKERTVELITDRVARTEYVACLILSLYGVQGNTQVSGKLFERLTSEAVECYLSGKAKVFGWPFERSSTFPTSEDTLLKQMMREAAEILGERFVEAPPSHFKDRDLDVIGWVPFSERRSGQVVILVQCGAGHNWKTKPAVQRRPWAQYIHWASEPLVGFSVPCIIDEQDWHEQSLNKGILFDRVRILNRHVATTTIITTRLFA